MTHSISSIRSRVPGSIAIRPMIAADVPAVARFYLEAWRTAYEGLVPHALLHDHSGFRPAAYERRRRRVLRGGRYAGARSWVAALDGVPIAFLDAGPSRDADAIGEGEVYAIYLDPAARGRGIGSRLLGHGVRWLRGQGYEAARLWVLRGNHGAERFYRRHGWQADGSRARFRIDGYPVTERRYSLRPGASAASQR